MERERVEKLIKLAQDKVIPNLEERPDIVIWVMAGAMEWLTNQLEKATDKSRAEWGGQSLLEGAERMVNAEKLLQTMPDDWGEEIRGMGVDLVQHALACAVATHVAKMVD
jgi:hypothetical protein